MKIRVIDQAVRDAISRYIKAHGGLSQAAFARTIGVSEQSMGRWINEDRNYAVRNAAAQERLWEVLEGYLDPDYRQVMASLAAGNTGEQSSDSHVADQHAEYRVLNAEHRILRAELRQMIDSAMDSLTPSEQVRIIQLCSQAIRRNFTLGMVEMTA